MLKINKRGGRLLESWEYRFCTTELRWQAKIQLNSTHVFFAFACNTKSFAIAILDILYFYFSSLFLDRQARVCLISNFRELFQQTCVIKIGSPSLDTSASSCLHPEISCVWTWHVMCFLEITVIAVWSEGMWNLALQPQKNISSLPQCWWSPNLAGCWFSMRSSHP